MVEHLPYGSWPSPITPEMLVSGAVRPSDVRAGRGYTWWSETRLDAGAQEQIVRRDPDGTTHDVLPEALSARTRLHEYGGAAWWVSGSMTLTANLGDQRLYRVDPRSLPPQPITPAPPSPHAIRYADGVVTPDGRWTIVVQETHRVVQETHRNDEVRNEIVTLPINVPITVNGQVQHVTTLVSGPDFVAAPRISPDGHRLAWLAWNHPDMPWDATELWLGDLDHDADGRPLLTDPRRVAGGPGESLVQPEWGPDGALYVVSDRTDWWNVYRVTGRVAGPADLVPVCPIEAEVALPAWTLGQSRYQIADDGTVWFTYSAADGAHLVEVRPGRPPVDHPLDCLALHQLRIDGDRLVAITAEAAGEGAVLELVIERDPDGGPTELVPRVLNTPRRSPLPAGAVSRARRIEFPTAGGRTAYAWFYPPSGDGVSGPHGELPPLLVGVHGGPTAAADPSFRLATQFWTSRGFAVVDVDYGGSTGYGRPYRRLLDGQWGVVDVEDACAAARWLAGEGMVDPARMAIRGGSAGGYTALAALCTTDVFAAGASHYGVTDLAALVRDTHKFESRYLDRLVGPWPEAEALYHERSPLSHLDGFDAPLIILQGLLDAVVPPAQAELIVSGLRRRGVPHAYLTFPDEYHGFRQPANIVRALTAELYFYSRIFGFELADDVEPIEITPEPKPQIRP